MAALFTPRPGLATPRNTAAGFRGPRLGTRAAAQDGLPPSPTGGLPPLSNQSTAYSNEGRAPSLPLGQGVFRPGMTAATPEMPQAFNPRHALPPLAMAPDSADHQLFQSFNNARIAAREGLHNSNMQTYEGMGQPVGYQSPQQQAMLAPLMAAHQHQSMLNGLSPSDAKQLQWKQMQMQSGQPSAPAPSQRQAMQQAEDSDGMIRRYLPLNGQVGPQGSRFMEGHRTEFGSTVTRTPSGGLALKGESNGTSADHAFNTVPSNPALRRTKMMEFAQKNRELMAKRAEMFRQQRGIKPAAQKTTQTAQGGATPTQPGTRTVMTPAGPVKMIDGPLMATGQDPFGMPGMQGTNTRPITNGEAAMDEFWNGGANRLPIPLSPIQAIPGLAEQWHGNRDMYGRPRNLPPLRR